ncbi:MAG: benzoyl-CoA 2,3-epoxidase subunit BoxB [Polyangia bacterium]
MTTVATVSEDKIPNNVNLSSDKRLQRALEQWLPNYLSWWNDVGPEGFQAKDVYLRTAISVDTDGWAHFDHVKMPDYRWGIFLTPQEEGKKIGFGDHMGQPVWNEVPGEYRNMLRRIIVTQADTEPASVEQQRLLGKTAPSLYDMRNLFQVNVEEGRHLWAMVYLLQSYFGKDGREEADALLERRSGDSDKPRILGAFNHPITTWLDFFFFTMFTDRDGKYQLYALAESGFDPLARTTRFMLTEEAHHMFVGETGVDRVVTRTAQLMAEGKDPAQHGAMPIVLLQKYLNLWFSLSEDLFGGEISSNAADFFASGLKGRYKESQHDEHKVLTGDYRMTVLDGGKLVEKDVPMRTAMNEVLRDNYVEDCQRAVDKWNRTLAKNNCEARLRLPSRRFHRNQGLFSLATTGVAFDMDGKIIDMAEWNARKGQWLPTAEDIVYVESLMKPVTEPGKIASWVAPPTRGVNGQPFDYEYVR